MKLCFPEIVAKTALQLITLEEHWHHF